MKPVPDYSEFNIDTINYRANGVYKMDSWEYWPDLETAYPSEVMSAINLWKTKGFEPPKRWYEFLEKNTPQGLS